jgi:hypothetical protein
MSSQFDEFETILLEHSYKDRGSTRSRIFDKKGYDTINVYTKHNLVTVISVRSQLIHNPTIDVLLFVIRYGILNADNISILVLDVIPWVFKTKCTKTRSGLAVNCSGYDRLHGYLR